MLFPTLKMFFDRCIYSSETIGEIYCRCAVWLQCKLMLLRCYMALRISALMLLMQLQHVSNFGLDNTKSSFVFRLLMLRTT